MSSNHQILTTLHEAAAEVGLVVRATEEIGPLPSTTRARLRQWIAEGRAGEMEYLTGATPLLEDPRAWKGWAKSLVIVALPYAREAGSFRGGGRVADVSEDVACIENPQVTVRRSSAELGSGPTPASLSHRFRVKRFPSLASHGGGRRGCLGRSGRHRPRISTRRRKG